MLAFLIHTLFKNFRQGRIDDDGDDEILQSFLHHTYFLKVLINVPLQTSCSFYTRKTAAFKTFSYMFFLLLQKLTGLQAAMRKYFGKV